MRFILDPEIKGIWARGGWGSARVLPHLDYDAIAQNPKVIVGYSDSTALLSGIHKRTGLVVFHGPFPRTTFTAEHQSSLLMDGKAPLLHNPTDIGSDNTVQTEDRTRTLHPGVARGRLLGGNLTVLTSIVGTPYLPDFEDAILFVEDVDEAVYRIDRMMTQLALSGVLGKLRGFIFGRCTDCPPGRGHGSLTLEEVLLDHIKPLGIPAFRGSMIGHIDKQFTLPIGAEVEINADAATIQILQPAVTLA
ncbi:MAG: muramoyltetrapeptide carboxypeptidase [Planctomycetota bacterium]|jgi:muramoyltetrapeptide carboxypeptidase